MAIWANPIGLFPQLLPKMRYCTAVLWVGTAGNLPRYCGTSVHQIKNDRPDSKKIFLLSFSDAEEGKFGAGIDSSFSFSPGAPSAQSVQMYHSSEEGNWVLKYGNSVAEYNKLPSCGFN